VRRHLVEHRAGRLTVQQGDQIPELKVTPDRYLTVRYAGASGDFNPIHIDDDFAKQVGLPGRILHGLWMMAQVARAQTEAGGGPQSLRRLQVQFRGMGLPEREITVTGTVHEVRDGLAVVHTVAEQDGKAIIRNAEAEMVLRRPEADDRSQDAGPNAPRR
jgi:acyl dehydratase